MRPRWRGKVARLEAGLAKLERVVVAYSGGVDSSFLLATAVDILGRENVLAATAASPTSTRDELGWARRLARRCRARHLVVATDEFSMPSFVRNASDRCYHCKRVRFSALKALARRSGFRHVVDGTNADDLRDYRPGMRAVRELRVRSPLLEAGLTKADIRAASHARKLPGWDRPAAACLASRCAYGEPLTPAKLSMIEAAERYLERRGWRQVRVRTHELPGGACLARIELPAGDLPARLMRAIDRQLRRLGYLYVTVDLGGYRMGSLNDLAGARRPQARRRSRPS